jgi:protein tyrosine/serine phosphatase
MRLRLSSCTLMLKLAGSSLALLVATLLTYLAFLQSSSNIHTVVENQCYRSAQLDAAELEAVVKRYGIQTVINLRGPKPGAPWYDQEMRKANELGVAHIDLSMSDRKELNFPESVHLIEIMKSARKPMLIHCKAGADRTGLACALYLAAIEHAGEEAAERQLSLRYGHLSIPMTPAYAMDETFEKLEPWLGYEGS